MNRISTLALLAALAAPPLPAQQAADPALIREIEAIRAIDSHAHPAPYPAGSDEKALPDSLPPFAPPARLRPSNPEYREAWRLLWGYDAPADGAMDVAELRRRRERTTREHGAGHPAWVLDQLGIETMLANHPVLGAGLVTPRFRWVWDVNPVLFPLDNSAAKSNPQRTGDFAHDEALLRGFLAEQHRSAIPPTLRGYLDDFVTPLMAERKRQGAISVKIYAAYERSLDFVPDVPEAEAAATYKRWAGGGVPDRAAYKRLQDFIFHRVARESGRLGMPVQIHVGAGAGPWFFNSGASQFLLDPVLNDPTLRGTTFVLVHGGLPFAAATRFLLGKPNVYTDLSSQGFLTSPREMSMVLRTWLSAFPEKVMFGTDAYPLTTTVGWEEVGWLSARSGRRALALALTGMMDDGEISRTRASEIARMVLRDNARRAYGLP